MQNATAMNADVKALLTLLLLKTGTTPKEIQTVLMVASTSRILIAEEYAASQAETSVEASADNVSRIRPAPSNVAANPVGFDPEADGMYSDIKALLSMVLLQNGVSTNEIQTTLRVAATSRRAVAQAQEVSAEQKEDTSQKPVSRTPERRQATDRQALRTDLSPISIRDLQRSAPLRRTA
jgi:hypothetical protein